ncbi:head completion adaptor [Vibrio phage 1.187.O._10N.286.49.F1]|nr:head completion adaptor [Vibrio phage 1.187.O._10N.286.49.F1]
MSDVEFIEWLRFWLSIDTNVISDEDLQKILDSVQAAYPDATPCQIKYYFAKATLEHLIRAEAKAQSGDGSVKKRREKVKNREIEVEFNTATVGSTETGWSKVLADLVSDPNSVGCEPFPSTDVGNTGSIIIGVQNDKYTFSSPYRLNLNPYSKKKSPWS